LSNLTQRLALIDDDVEIRQLLCDYLTKNGFEVRAFADGEVFLVEECSQFDLVVLDIGLPGVDGLEVCRKLRQNSNVPIIMLTAASDDFDRILGLELGADDYMGKPFNPRELLARIKALLRRANTDVNLENTLNKIEMNFAARSVTINDIQLELTGAEFDLLCVFTKQVGVVLSRDTIGELLHGRRVQPFDRSIDTIVSRLRSKLSDHFEGEIIQSVRGKGYVLLLKQ
jgi:DNA-binding response OmpR family regulator